ncbi:MAG: CDP-diacylglycerol--glycerol-3-phosphate 3-phosphatidyltransferase [Lysobacterales bacterium CG02_land_8_20_14_3_00_62_12]|nr:MAG: CDP-diacylglycerol--glycerol-3-phosphate 3-phosphatidyltransferase [Xanthomonadales bacterium CG02_land_8_20_14_3_00_62_12]PJA39794.1 MAG: CDP-diacylglycerol--glycerol-3-phosphate 3-phosphatidyltransferase [Xanthomonadales bacterium CG_4_9_14_3_um_filter_62_6]
MKLRHPHLLTLPNMLTMFRIVLVPILVATFYLPFKGANLVAAGMFAVGAITDWLDGWIARRFGQTSAFGAFLDPVADKLTVTVTLFLLVQADPSPLMAVICAIIVGREITISALREWMAEIGERSKVKVAGLGKIKTIVQMVAIVILLWRQPGFDFHVMVGVKFYELGQWMLGTAAVLTIWSGVIYLRAAWPIIRDRKN